MKFQIIIRLLLIIIALQIIHPLSVSAATYSYAAGTYSWIDPSSHTNAVWTAAPGGPANECTSNSAAIDDDITQELSLGFTFSFGGTNYTTVRIMSNGRLQFNNRFCGYGTQSNSIPRIYPYPMPDTRLNRTMRVYGADLDPSIGGSVRYTSLGATPNRSFVVTWTNISEWGSASSNFNLQVILYENGSFKYQYGSITNSTQGHAQIGWEASTSDYELSIYSNVTTLQNTALLFSADNPSATVLYSLDEATWSGATGEIKDSSGSLLNGTAIGSAQTVSNGYVCRGGEITGNNQAIGTAVNPNTTIGTRGTIAFWYNNSSNWNSGNTMLADASNNLGNNTADKYFFLVKRTGGRLRFVLEANNDTDLVVQTGNNNFASGTWHHIAIAWDLNEDADYLQIYIDGTRSATSRGNRNAPLNIPDALGTLNSLYVGDNRTSGVGGSNYANRAANGIYDEVYFFSEVLSSTQISSNMSETHACLLSAWNMDESSWNGTLGEVVDSSSLGYNGTAANGATTGTSNPAIAGSPGTCGYGNLDGTNDYIALPGFPNLTGDFTIAAWIRADRIDKDQRIFVDDENNSNGFAFSLGDGGNGRLRFFSRGVSPVILDSSAVITANTWYHVAAVHNNTAKTKQIFLNGVAVTSAQTYSGTWGSDSGTAAIGGETNAAGSEATSNWRFDGSIDEVRVYTKAMSAAEISNVMNETRACAITFDHLLIEHDGTALTCEPETITVRACANASCSAEYTSSDVSISLTPVSGWAGGNNQTVIGGNSAFTLAHTTAEPVTLGITSSSPSPTNTVQCLNTSTSANDCTLTYYDSGFIYNVPDLTSCATSANITVSAVRLDNTSQACLPTFQNTTKTINFWSTYSSPASGANQVVLNNGTANTTIATSSPGTGVSLNFNASGQASITATYNDAGQLSLNSNYTSGTLTMSGSDSFISVPSRLYVYSDDANAACASNGATCSVITKAGSSFNLKVRAACADNTVTPNFVLNNIALAHTNTAPAVAQGTLGVASFNMVSADNGDHTISTQTVSEVGVFTFTATSPAYLSAPGPSGTSTYIGRFTPDHFCVSNANLTNRTDSNTQASCTDSFSYLDEDFTDTFTLTAQRNGATCSDGTSTSNYSASFSKFNTTALLSGDDTSNANETGLLNFAALDSTSSTNLSPRINFNTASSTSSGQFTSGSLNVTSIMNIARSGSAPGYTAETAFTSTDIGIKPIDTDSITLSSTNLTIGGATYFNVGNTALYFGRLYADNTFGTEQEGLPMWAEPQYCNAQSGGVCNDWKTKADDTCSLFTVTAPTDTIIGETSGGGNGYWVSGINYSASSGITYAADSNNHKAGWLVWYTAGGTGGTYTIPFVTHPYLITEDGSASFGLYRGDDRIIYWREIFQ